MVILVREFRKAALLAQPVEKGLGPVAMVKKLLRVFFKTKCALPEADLAMYGKALFAEISAFSFPRAL